MNKKPVLILISVNKDAYTTTTAGATAQKANVDPEKTTGNNFHPYRTNRENDMAVCVELTNAMPVVTQSK